MYFKCPKNDKYNQYVLLFLPKLNSITIKNNMHCDLQL